MKYIVVERNSINNGVSDYKAFGPTDMHDAAAHYGKRMIQCIEIWMIDEDGFILFHALSDHKDVRAPFQVLAAADIQLRYYVAFTPYTDHGEGLPIYMGPMLSTTRVAKDAEAFHTREQAIELGFSWGNSRGYVHKKTGRLEVKWFRVETADAA